jgi:hypothetical protein
VNCAKKGGLGDVPCWQGNCLGNGGEILVALKRNDEYALAHQSGARLMGFGALGVAAAALMRSKVRQ